MAAACEEGFLNATDVADYLVRKGMPFRTAHEVSAKAVRTAIAKHCRLEDLSLSDLKVCSELIDGDIYSCITPSACVESRKTAGGPAPECVKEQIAQLRRFVSEGDN